MARLTTAERIVKISADIDAEQEKVTVLEKQLETLSNAIKEKKAHIRDLQEKADYLRGVNVIEVARSEGVPLEDIINMLKNKDLRPLLFGDTSSPSKDEEPADEPDKQDSKTKKGQKADSDEGDEASDEPEETEESDDDEKGGNPWD